MKVILYLCGVFVGFLFFESLFADDRLVDARFRSLDVGSCIHMMRSILKGEDSASLTGFTSTQIKEVQMRVQSPRAIDRIGQRWGIPMAAFTSSPHPEEPTGDFYYVRRLRNGHIVTMMGDVMSHGAGAGRASVFLQHLIRQDDVLAEIDKGDPLTVFQKLDQRVDQFAKPLAWTKFDLVTISMAMVIFDPNTGRVRVLSTAGIPRVSIINAQGETRIIETSLPFLTMSTGYDDFTASNPAHAEPAKETELLPGENLLMMSDGVGDSHYLDQGKFETALEGRVRFKPQLTPSQVVNHIQTSISEVKDDASILVFQRPFGG